MVARPPDYDELRNQISQREQEQQQNSSSTSNSSVRDSLQSLFALSSLFGGGGGGNGEQTANSQFSRSGESNELNPSPEVSTSLEPIRQSLLTIHTLLSTMNTTPSTRDNREGISTSTIFPSHTRKYFVGQWLDVKDTVNQWLEATVMQIDHEQNRIFVHYNGW